MSLLSRFTNHLWSVFVSGLVTVIPIAVTLYLVVWASRSAEHFFGAVVKLVIPDGWYIPGLGIAMAIGFVLLVGAFLRAWLVDQVLRLGDRLLERIPLVQTIYTGVRDLMRFLSNSREQSKVRQAVLVQIQDDIHVIGFVTDDEPATVLPELNEDDDGEERVSVYLPMGYQIGGYTLYLPRSRLRPLNLGIEEAMRMVLTAGVNRPARPGGRDTDTSGDRP